MGKKTARKTAAAAAAASPVCDGGADEREEQVAADAGDGDETAGSGSSGEEDGAAQASTGCCSASGGAKEVASVTSSSSSACCSSDKEDASGSVTTRGDCCGGNLKPKEKGGSCCSSEPGAAGAGGCASKGQSKPSDGSSCCSLKTADDVKAAENCCSSKDEAKAAPSCRSSSKNDLAVSSCCSSKPLEASNGSGCCSSEVPKSSSGGCCSSKKESKASDCCSSKAPTTSNGTGCCSAKAANASSSSDCCSSSAKVLEEASSSSGCCSSKSETPAPRERSASFLERVMRFRSDRGAAHEKQRSRSGSSTKKTQQAEALETLRLHIVGMTCSGCCTRIERFLETQRGVVDVNVSLLTSRGVFQYDPRLVSAKHIEQTVATLGFEPSELASEELASVVLHLGRPESAPRAKKLLLQTPGVVSAEAVDEPAVYAVSTGSPWKVLLVEYDPDVTGARTIVRWLSRELGFTVQASSPRAPSACAGEEEVRRFTRLLFWSCLLSLPVLVVEFVLPAIFSSTNNPANVGLWGTASRVSIKDAVELACATPVLFMVARPIHESAFLALRYGGRVTMDVLISLSASTAYAFSVFTLVTEALAVREVPATTVPPLDPLAESTPPPQQQEEAPVRAETFFQVTVLLVTLILVGRYVETLAKARASNSVDALLRIQAKTAILLEEDGEKESYIDVVLVQRDDLLKVLPGTRVPTDGVVVGGASSVDESMVTGEARKVPKEPGAIVIGGSTNSQGVLTMRVTHTLHESLLARMVRLVGEAQASRGVRQSIADAVATYFTTFIIVLAVGMFALWYALASGGHVDTRGWAPFPFALRFAITVLVISCPCAISLAVPTAVMVAITKGSQVGVLFKGGRVLEALEDVDVVVFDKTGTLTTARLGVADVFTATENVNVTQLWRYVAAAESGSEHAIGKALVVHAEEQIQGSIVDKAQGFEAVPGCGVRCIVGSADVRLGSLTWLQQETHSDRDALKVSVAFHEANKRFQAQGCIVVFVAIDNTLEAAIALRDAPRPEARRVIEELKREGIQPWIVTGDQRGTALSVAAALGIPEGSVLADTLPHQKVDKVRLLQSLGRRVAFVGDGVNDAPALATADVGVALGAGTDVALEAADVVLVKDDLRDLLNARALSRATNSRIKHNFAWGFMYNLLMMPLACGALYAPLGLWIPPALAGLSELLSSVPVILFSLLLNLWKPPFSGNWGLQQNHVAIDVAAAASESTPLLCQ
ncbi:hypothetical protein BBJ28_00010639 [Nothophytophthora sp. Chile5]|nr:hypothetical protein BBJ28_00010639 [Nothophytophthora sp. Chile5]